MPDIVRVRAARPSDLERVAAILVEGFRTKFEAAFRERMDRAERIIARSLALEVPRNLPGLYVAEVTGEVAGTIALRRRGQPEPPIPPSLGIFFEELGLWGGLRAMFYMSLLDQSIRRHEVYVSDVAVDPAFRRRGVAKSMLVQAETVARQWREQALVLDVGAGNEAAIHLYRKLGYTEQRIRRSLLTKWLLGIEQWVRMRKEIG